MTMNRREALRSFSAVGAAVAVPGVLGGVLGCEGEVSSQEQRLLNGFELYPPWAEATDLGFVGQLRNATGEKLYRAVVDGRLPRGLRGTLYRNGPGLYERAGLRKRAVVDGDGMIRRYCFDGRGRVTFQNRFVRTPKFVEESAAGHYLYHTWTTPLPGMPGAPQGHNGGVTPVVHDGMLYAFDENTAPFLLDPDNLETLGLAENFIEAGWDYKAHTRKDLVRGEWICFAVRLQPGDPGTVSVAHHVFDAHGARLHSRAVDLPLPSYIHDFFVTEDWIVYYNMPARIQWGRIAVEGFAPSLAWDEQAGAYLVIVPRRGDGAPITIQTEARWTWHTANAFQQRGEIIADYVAYDGPESFLFAGEAADPAFYAWMQGREGDYENPGKVRRMVIDPARRTVRHEVLLEGNYEFPVVSRAVNGRRHRHMYLIEAAGESQWWDAVVALDTRSGMSRRHQFGAGHFLSEPIYVPDPENARPERDAGWLLVPVYEQQRAASSLAVFRADAIEDGPIAAVRLEDHDPWAFHGYWEA